jgi:LacI family transcriptional regulator
LDNRLDDRYRLFRRAARAMPTIKDVAQRAGVSPTTVSYVLTGSRFVRPDTKARIVRAIEELNYQPDQIARSLRAKRTMTVGMIISDITNPFYADIVRGVEDVLSERHYSLILCNTDEAPERELATLQMLIRKKTDGLIVVATAANAEALRAANLSGLPIVLVDRRLPGDWLDTVLTDDRQGAETAVRHLLRLGHRRIGAIIGRTDISTTDSRRLGYEAALMAFGVPVDPDLIRSGQSTVKGGAAAAQALLDLHPRPTAIFAANNLMTLGLFLMLKEYGLRSPQDVAVAGFDDMIWLSAFAPGVTTVAQPNYELGKRAAELLMDRLTGQPPESPRVVVLPTQLVVRESCGYHIARPTP